MEKEKKEKKIKIEKKMKDGQENYVDRNVKKIIKGRREEGGGGGR